MSAHARSRELLSLDPSYPYQLEGDLFAIWLPRGRGRDERARGLVCRIFPCRNPRCLCSEVRAATLAIDDRAGTAYWERDALSVVARAHTELKVERRENISIDYFTGVVRRSDGGELSSELAPFFREPLPGWFLDDLYGRWVATREPLAWREHALSEWEPGTLLSHMLVYPTARFDQYVRDGAVYQVDFVFCTQPGCACTNGRFCVLQVERESDDGLRLTELGSVRLEASDMELTDFHGDRPLVTEVYLDWRSRHPAPADRLRALRDDTRRRGAELHALVTRRPSPPIPFGVGGRVGRNDPCRCGSGKKFKRCCGQ